MSKTIARHRRRTLVRALFWVAATALMLAALRAIALVLSYLTLAFATFGVGAY